LKCGPYEPRGGESNGWPRGYWCTLDDTPGGIVARVHDGGRCALWIWESAPIPYSDPADAADAADMAFCAARLWAVAYAEDAGENGLSLKAGREAAPPRAPDVADLAARLELCEQRLRALHDAVSDAVGDMTAGLEALEELAGGELAARIGIIEWRVGLGQATAPAAASRVCHACQGLGCRPMFGSADTVDCGLCLGTGKAD
jgi:hypothetical protein